MLVLAVVSIKSLDVPVLVMLLFPVAAIVYSAGYLFFFKGFEVGNVSIVARGDFPTLNQTGAAHHG